MKTARDVHKSKNLRRFLPNLFCLWVAQGASVEADLRVQEMAGPQAALPRTELCVERSVEPLFLWHCRLVRGGGGGGGSGGGGGGGLLGQGLPLAAGALRRTGAVPRDAALGTGLAGTGRRGLSRSGEARGRGCRCLFWLVLGQFLRKKEEKLSGQLLDQTG